MWAYDLLLKPTPLGPVAMAGARALDVLLGAGRARAGLALPEAATVGAHTLALTALSRGEVHGGGRGWAARAGLAVSAALTALVTLRTDRDERHSRRDLSDERAVRPNPAQAATAALAGAYAATVVPAQLRAAREPTAGSVRRAVGAGILGTVPLQAALLARARALPVAAAVAALLPIGRAGARRIATT